MSTAGYLQDAKNQQKRLAEIITAKGITATATEKYKDLVDKVAQIENLKGEERTLENFTNALSEPKSVVQLEYPDNTPKTLNAKLGSKNSFDISSSVGFQSRYQGVTSTISGTTITTSSTANCSCSLLLGDFSVGTYTISFSNTDFSFLMLQYGETLEQLSRLDNVDFKTTKSHTFTLTQPAKLWLESTTGTGATKFITDIQLELGSTATAYTPYISDLSTVTVTRRGKNLFDINNPTYAALSKVNTAFLPTIEDGVISFNTYYSQRGGSGFVIPVEPNTTITISFDSVGSGYWTEIMAVESILDNVAINIYKYPQFKNITKYTLTQRADKHYILFILNGINGYHTAKIKNLQIEKGSTATPYEPYQGQTYTPTTTGEVTGITNLYPTTTLLTDNAGVVFEQVTGGLYKEILPSTDKNGITKVYQPSVDSTIDSNIKPENIKKGVKILGILGTYDGN